MSDQNPPTEGPDPQILMDLVTKRMPFGKYQGSYLCDLPVHYLEFFQREGFPNGKLGMQLATLYEIKTNGLSDILRELKKYRK